MRFRGCTDTKRAMLQRLTAPITVFALAVALAACNRTNDTSAAPPAAASTRDSASGEVAQYALMKNSIGWLTDSNIVALATQVNSAAQGSSKLEAQGWSIEALRSLATGIVAEHARMQYAIDSVASLKRIPSQVPAVAPSVQAPYDSMLRPQIGLPLAERESKFLDMLLAEHARTTTDFAALAGNASDPDLRALLANRGVMMEQAHVARAKLIQAAFSRADSVRADSAKAAPRRGGR